MNLALLMGILRIFWPMLVDRVICTSFSQREALFLYDGCMKMNSPNLHSFMPFGLWTKICFGLFMAFSLQSELKAIEEMNYSKTIDDHKIKAIYGLDERELMENHSSQTLKDMGRAVLAQFPSYMVFDETDKHIMIRNRTLQEAHQVCPGEKFVENSSLSTCTGFLVSNDLMITAGHCMKDKEDCSNNIFSFDYHQSRATGEYLILPKENVYRCKQVISSSYGTFSKTDYAIVKLDRPVEGRKPLRIRRLGKIDSKESVFVLGHPMGLPQMYTPNGKIRSNIGLNSFVTNLDTFSGNSGSPVLNASTNMVEGILVKGEDDLDYDIELGCYKNRVCRDNECRGETVVRTTAIPISKIPLLK